jgi:NAD(P)-dependent dehydrogenase (short-subunit alcohol dehydrogenase family)
MVIWTKQSKKRNPTMTPRLANRTALVTGATSNIGRAIAIALARAGAHVVVQGRDAVRAEDVARTIREAGGRADVLLAELDGTEANARDVAARATALLGRVDILVNNAGIFPPATTVETDGATFDRVFAVNVKTPFFLVAALAPGMADRGHGQIINLGSWIVRLGLPLAQAYSASKGALETLTRTWAAEFGPRGVRVNTISPGVMHEPTDTLHPGDALMRGTPAGGPGDPRAIGDAAVFLASDEASFLHGSLLEVDGGRTSVAVVAS